MKLLKGLYLNLGQALSATFFSKKLNSETCELPMPGDDMNLENPNYEKNCEENLIELGAQYKANVFLTRILFLVLLIGLSFSIYLALRQNIYSILICIPTLTIHKIWVNSRILTGMKKSLISFSFMGDEDISNYYK